MTNFSRRMKALIKKEFLQMFRDRSSLIIGIIVPIMMILLIGFGMSFDVKNIPVAVVLEDTSPTAQDMVSFLDGSDYFSPYYVTSLHEGEALLDHRKAEAILIIPSDFTESLAKGTGSVQMITYGVDATTARTAGGYLESGIAQWSAEHSGTYLPELTPRGSINIISRQWFNDANTSTWFFIPGLIVIVQTLVGVFLTTLVMSREWERGTLESLFITPVRPLEIVLAKMIPYFCISFSGFMLCIFASRFLYHVPMHGPLWIIIFASMEFIFVSLGMGLTISSVLKNQFLACQIALTVSMLPTVMLSGFIFDLHNVPFAINVIGHLVPATYYMELLKSLFLAGTNWFIITRNCSVLAAYAVLFTALSFIVTKKRL
ncbi:ABC transporter permease [Megasphaera vaginalis (ex Srinivasan et al. 2021)]|uniref:ABC-2 family transporter protein n=1 Tax=Megasphaera vaginalis (ex Srinivasan et al. 2021) TaxID=1111454 RepID=U7UED1_9FIRM|nr:ABC transporter permease [Megasphaera vaginalis (ex Srinivasan et al. 2021)]ERT57792.1 ABC-2 family transporter protein [Megasphaera vaginalis (ex Srinivasan et al. 2021)]